MKQILADAHKELFFPLKGNVRGDYEFHANSWQVTTKYAFSIVGLIGAAGDAVSMHSQACMLISGDLHAEYKVLLS